MQCEIKYSHCIVLENTMTMYTFVEALEISTSIILWDITGQPYD